MSEETFEEFIQRMKERATEEGIEISASFSIFQLENSCEYIWNHQQQKLDKCNKTMSRQLADIKMLHKELDTKDAEIKELDCRLLVESDNNRIAEHRIKELKNEIGKWLSHVTKLDDILETLREINSTYKKAEDDLEVSCLIGEILDRPEVKALLERDKI